MCRFQCCRCTGSCDLPDRLRPLDAHQLLVQPAVEIGELVGIEAELAGTAKSPRKPFSYWDKGNMATIGRASAVIATKRFAKAGLLAWLLWWAVHIMFLVGFRNRFFVILSWAWSWLSFKRGARLITGKVDHLPSLRSISPHGEPAVPRGAATVALEQRDSA